MGKGSLAVLMLIALGALAIGIFIKGLEAEEEGEVKLAVSFGAIVILVFVVLALSLYLARVQTTES